MEASSRKKVKIKVKKKENYEYKANKEIYYVLWEVNKKYVKELSR